MAKKRRAKKHSEAVYGDSATMTYHKNIRNDQCCKSEILERNQVDFENENAAITAGYHGCQTCCPDMNPDQ